MKSQVPMLTRLVQMPRIPSRNPTYCSPSLVVQTLACCPTSLGVDYQRDGKVWLQSSFYNVSVFSFIDFLL